MLEYLVLVLAAKALSVSEVYVGVVGSRHVNGGGGTLGTDNLLASAREVRQLGED
jgi:hypothetical protein